jgi:hypothetical protein
MPGSAKGVMFITIEDEGGIANLLVSPWIFENHPRGRHGMDHIDHTVNMPMCLIVVRYDDGLMFLPLHVV